MPASLPDPLEETIRSVRRLHVEHKSNATRLERTLRRFTGAIGRPVFLGLLGFAVTGWIGANLAVQALGYPTPDGPPFPWLQGAMTAVSLFMVAFIVGAQKHDDDLSEQREMIILELALLNDQKIAKLIQLLEEFRRDSPQLSDRLDEEAEVMAKPADTQSVFSAIKEARSAVHASPGDASSG